MGLALPLPEVPLIDSLRLTAARTSTCEHQRVLTNASGFFFERAGRLCLPTSRHDQSLDAASEIDVAVLEIERSALPVGAVIRAFTPAHTQPVARQAVVASAFGLRLQGQGHFLTDARTHCGSSGAPVVRRDHDAAGRGGAGSDRPWRLRGVHSASLDMSGRDRAQDETLGLSCARYADLRMALTEPGGAPAPAKAG